MTKRTSPLLSRLLARAPGVVFSENRRNHTPLALRGEHFTYRAYPDTEYMTYHLDTYANLLHFEHGLCRFGIGTFSDLRPEFRSL